MQEDTPQKPMKKLRIPAPDRQASPQKQLRISPPSEPKKQLRIGAPKELEPARIFWENFSFTLLTCSVIFLLALPYVFITPAQPTLSPEEQHDLEQQQITARYQKFQLQPLSELKQEVSSWDHLSFIAAFTYGPRPAAEVACEYFLSLPIADSPEGPRRQQLFDLMASALDAQQEHAPRICLMAHMLHERLPEDTPETLKNAISAYWERVKKHESIEAQDAFMLNGLRLSDRLPHHNKEFIHFIRDCATRTQHLAWKSCVKTASQIQPPQGADLLEFIELSLIDRKDKTQPPTTESLTHIATLLGRLVELGSPEEWKVSSRDILLNYDYDLRLAASFMLCRFAMSPNQDVAKAATQAFIDAIHYSDVPSSKNIFRVRDSCRITFGGQLHDVEVASYPILVENKVPALPVVINSTEETPHYTFFNLIQRGDCAVKEELPIWYCGTQLWKGQDADVISALKNAYINTRYVNWAQSDWIPDHDHLILRKDNVATLENEPVLQDGP